MTLSYAVLIAFVLIPVVFAILATLHLKQGEDPRSPGQIGYEAYGDYANWKAFNDAPMPRWDGLREDIKAKWEVAAQAILKH